MEALKTSCLAGITFSKNFYWYVPDVINIKPYFSPIQFKRKHRLFQYKCFSQLSQEGLPPNMFIGGTTFLKTEFSYYIIEMLIKTTHKLYTYFSFLTSGNDLTPHYKQARSSYHRYIYKMYKYIYV